MSQPRSIKLYNPAFGIGHTSRKKAIEAVERGRARWRKDGTLEFIADDHRHVAVTISVNAGYDRAARTGCATKQDLRNLPMVGNIDRLFGRGRQKRSGAKQAA